MSIKIWTQILIPSLFIITKVKIIQMSIKWWRDKQNVVYEVCPESIQPRTMKNRNIYWRRYKIQETLSIEQRCPSPLQSRHFGTSQNTPSHHQLPCHIFLNLINGLNLFPFKGDFSLGKARSQGMPNLGCKGAESPVIWCLAKKLHKMWCMSVHVVMMKLPITSCP